MCTVSPFLSSAELCCCSGMCIDLPCMDRYAPNQSGCCCCTPRYIEEVHDIADFYQTVLPQLHTGDVVLCSWPVEGQTGTQISRCMAHTRTSHVGMVYRPSDSPGILKHRDMMFPDKVHASRPLMLHVIAAGECGPRMRTEKGGMDIVDLEVWTKDYMDKFSHCHKDCAEDVSMIGRQSFAVRMLVGVERDEAFYQAVEDVVEKYINTEFEKNVMTANVMVSQIDVCQAMPCCCCIRARKDTSMLFCSELTADAYKHTGLIDSGLNPSEMIPAMWDTTRKLKLRGDASLTVEHVCLGPATLEERRAMGYPDMADPSVRVDLSCETFGPGGFFGVDVAQPVQVLDAPAMARM
mmetsp:Transcript_79050/g.218798  ORF Transcript_79050/g.218798 Transcript_79050/m.218798 type:complete len:351 (+) Transcript_79050:130-1182(+)